MISTNYINLTSNNEFHEDLVFLQSHASGYEIIVYQNLRLFSYKG